jgi:hypothetical protein
LQKNGSFEQVEAFDQIVPSGPYSEGIAIHITVRPPAD